jgi:splicing factor 3B subunit 3
VSPLPGNPTAVWTIKRSLADEYDAYIIVSFSNATLVLRWVGGWVQTLHNLVLLARFAICSHSLPCGCTLTHTSLLCLLPPSPMLQHRRDC